MKKRKFRYGYIWVTLALFFGSLAGHWLFGWRAYVSEAAEHGQAAKAGEYADQMLRDTLENWQSEFLQLVWQVGGLTWLWSLGSPQSREGSDRLEEKVDFLMERIEGGAVKRTELDLKYPRK